MNLSLLLEGPYDANGQMEADLLNNIPFIQPYNASPYNYDGNEVLPFIPFDAIDWVLVEARGGTPNLGGEKGTVTVESRAGILRSNGSITDVNGNPLLFQNLDINQAYYFCVRHRNHLDVLSSTSFSGGSGIINYDFSSDVTQAFGLQQQKVSSDGYALLHAGDFNQDGIIQNTDNDAWMNEPALLNVYSSLDANLDGLVQVTDFDAWFLNKAKVGSVEIGYD